MSEISSTVVAVNRYAPEGANGICLYNYNGAEGMTMGQLIASFAFRRAANCEARSVAIMNQMNGKSEQIEFLCASAEEILLATDPESDGGKAARTNWENRRAELKAKAKIDDSSLPTTIDTYDDAMRAFSVVKEKLVEANSSLDKITVELESTVSRRDSVMALSTATIKHYADGCMNQAMNF